LHVVDLNDIADLIRSLGKAEKRFFKMMISTENVDVDLLVKLFNEIEKESVSVEKLERSGYYTEYDIDKLYTLILKSLRGFHAESCAVFRIKDEILNLRCLFDKAQYRQCRKMLASLKSELYEDEQFGFLLKLFDIEKKLIVFEEGKEIQPKPAIIAQEEQSVIHKEEKILQYQKLLVSIMDRIAEKDETLSGTLSNPLLTDNLDTLSRKESVFVLKCKERIYSFLNQKIESELCCAQIKELFAKHKFLKEYFLEIV
jgi:hypothetical protein